MRTLVALVGFGIAVAGCNSGPSTEESAGKTGEIRLENATAEEVVKQAKAAQAKNRIQPGEWENSARIVSFSLPGAPDALKAQLDEELKKPPTVKKECRSEKDADANDLAQIIPQASGCTFPKYQLAGGKIDAQMECPGPTGPVSMTVSGTQSATAYDLTLTQIQPVPGQTEKSTVTMQTTGKRLGDCKQG